MEHKVDQKKWDKKFVYMFIAIILFFIVEIFFVGLIISGVVPLVLG